MQDNKVAVQLPTKIVDTIGRIFAVSPSFLTGGFVRDTFLKMPDYHDIDINVVDLKKVLSTLDSLGFKPTGEAFDVWSLFIDGIRLDVVQLRKEMYRDESRKPVVTPTSDVYEDLGRRDFTINSIALRPVEFRDASIVCEVINPFNGLADLEAGVVRAVGDPDRRFFEDPLRILRAVRFASKFGFRIDDATTESIRRNVKRLGIVSEERIVDEIGRTLLQKRSGLAVRMLYDLGILQYLVPEFDGADGVRHDSRGNHHGESVIEHTAAVVEKVPADLETTLSALFHDIGKMATLKVEEDGRRRFIGHDEVSAAVVHRTLRRLKFPNAVVRDVTLVVRSHMLLHHVVGNSEVSRRRHFAELFQEFGENGLLLRKLIDLAEADAGQKDVYQCFRDLLSEYLATPRLVTGRDLDGVEKTLRGPALKHLRLRQLYQRLGRDQLLKLVKNTVDNLTAARKK